MTIRKSAKLEGPDARGGDRVPFLDQLRGLRECIAYIREDALACGENVAADLLVAACQVLDTSIERHEMFPGAQNFRH